MEDALSDYHKNSHQEATNLLKDLYIGIQNYPNSNTAAQDTYAATGCPGDVKLPAIALDEINEWIKKENVSRNKDPELGIIRYQQMLGLWRASIAQPAIKHLQTEALISFCQQFGYPEGWAKIGMASRPAQAQAQPTQAESTQAQSAQAQSTQILSQGQPTSVIGSQYAGGRALGDANLAQTSSQGQGMGMVGPQLNHRYAGGRVRTIALIPRQITRSINPGYTSTGERILMIQLLGPMSGARFVVEDASGKVRLVSSASAGGKLVLEGATATGVPYTTSKEQDILNIREAMRAQFGITYGLKWVAVGEVDVNRRRSPYVIVGFYFGRLDETSPQQEFGVSRSALKRILTPTEADRLISEAITYDPNLALQDAISSMTCLALRSGPVSGGVFDMPQPLLLQQSAPQYQRDPLSGQSSHQQQQLTQPSYIQSMSSQMQQPGRNHLAAHQQSMPPQLMQQPGMNHLAAQQQSMSPQLMQ